AGVRADQESNPLLQPGVSLDVRAVWRGDVHARSRADRQSRGRTGCRPRLRVRAVSILESAPSSSALVRMDAAGVSGAAPLFRDRPHPATRRSRRCLAGAEPLMRVLPVFLLAGHGRLHRVGYHDAWTMERQADAAARRIDGHGSPAVDTAVSAAVLAVATDWPTAATARRDHPLFGRRSRVLHRG